MSPIESDAFVHSKYSTAFNSTNRQNTLLLCLLEHLNETDAS